MTDADSRDPHLDLWYGARKQSSSETRTRPEFNFQPQENQAKE